MTAQEKHLGQTASLMCILGWLFGSRPHTDGVYLSPGIPLGRPAGGLSEYRTGSPAFALPGLHPYLYMLGALSTKRGDRVSSSSFAARIRTRRAIPRTSPYTSAIVTRK